MPKIEYAGTGDEITIVGINGFFTRVELAKEYGDEVCDEYFTRWGTNVEREDGSGYPNERIAITSGAIRVTVTAGATYDRSFFLQMAFMVNESDQRLSSLITQAAGKEIGEINNFLATSDTLNLSTLVHMMGLIKKTNFRTTFELARGVFKVEIPDMQRRKPPVIAQDGSMDNQNLQNEGRADHDEDKD